MRDAIANLQSLYRRRGRVFCDGPSEPSDVSRRTGGRDPQRQSSAGREAPSCRATADSRASEQDNSFAAPSRHRGSRYVPRESVDHRASSPIAVLGAGILTPNPSELQAEVGRLQKRLHDLCDCTEQERQERLSLEAWVQRIRLYRSDDRSELRSTNWRTSESVKPFATTWLTFVASMRHYRTRLRNWLGPKTISWRFLSVAVVFARGRDLVMTVRTETADIKRRYTERVDVLR
uniref:RxLR effector candidate protein n=1 Tax=Hyaloperonospora arabidopsidis (strain Emoy2) TaxID=559515 RepID=M4B2D5_HYAAE